MLVMVGLGGECQALECLVAGLFGLGSIEHTMFSDSDPPPSVDLTFDAFNKHTLFQKHTLILCFKRQKLIFLSAFGFVNCK